MLNNTGDFMFMVLFQYSRHTYDKKYWKNNVCGLFYVIFVVSSKWSNTTGVRFVAILSVMNIKIGMPCESTVVYKTLANMSMDAALVWGIVVLAAVFFCGGFCCFRRFFPHGLLHPYPPPLHPAMFQGYHNPGYHNPGSHPNNAGYHPQFYPPQQNTDPHQNNLHNQREPEPKPLPVQKHEFVVSYAEGHHPLHPQEHKGTIYAQPSQSHIDPRTGRDHSIPLVVPHPSVLNRVTGPSVLHYPTGPPIPTYHLPFHQGVR